MTTSAIVLGSAAGGGSPQWNCDCPVCDAVRTGSRPSRRRRQSALAVGRDDAWVLVNVSPDVRDQIEDTPRLRPTCGRSSPVRAVLLTDAELDHTLGLLMLREAGALDVHATARTFDTMAGGTRVIDTLERYCTVHRTFVEPERDVEVLPGLSYRAFSVPTTKQARFGPGTETGRVGYVFRSHATGGRLAYLPVVQEMTPKVLEAIDGCDAVLVDGTCWTDDEMASVGLASKTSRAMGHIPISGPGGSLEQLRGLSIGRTIYVHLNNTNPVLLEDSPERQALDDSGAEVAHDGLEVMIAHA